MATTETILEATIKAGVERFGGFPSGTMIAFAGKSVPDGWLLCNGALVSRTTYAKLFAAIGTAWGAGDGSTTFKLPDADGLVLQGVTDVGKVGQYLEAKLPNITGSTRTLLQSSDSTSKGCFYDDVAAFNRGSTSVATGNGWGKIYFSSKNSNSIYSGNDVQMNALQTLMIIKV